MSKLLIFILFLSLLTKTSFGDNLIGESGDRQIIVLKDNKNRFQFKYCSKTEDDEIECEFLSRKAYTREQLDQIAKKEKTEAILKTTGVTIGSILVVTTSLAVGLGAAGIEMFAMLAGISPGWLAGSVGKLMLIPLAGTAAVPFIKKLNPRRQFKQANIINKYDFMENDVVVSDKAVKKAADLLREILD